MLWGFSEKEWIDYIKVIGCVRTLLVSPFKMFMLDVLEYLFTFVLVFLIAGFVLDSYVINIVDIDAKVVD